VGLEPDELYRPYIMPDLRAARETCAVVQVSTDTMWEEGRRQAVTQTALCLTVFLSIRANALRTLLRMGSCEEDEQWTKGASE
jgi:hypothetical protein